MGLSQGISFPGVTKMRLSIFVILAVTTLVISVAAQTSLSLWPYYIEVTPNDGATGIYDVIVPLHVFDKSTAELGDLRLFDSSNREVPYAIRVRDDVDDVEEFEGSLFNHGQVGSASEVSVDLGEEPEEHNEVEIDTTGTNFRRQVSIEGSDNGQDWRLLNNSGVLFSFASQNNSVDSKRVSYPTSRYRYLRVRVQRDALADKSAPPITGVKAMMALREKGLLSSWNVPVPSYQLERNQGAHASVWTLDLGARAPCDRLTLDIDEDSFSRPFQVDSVDDTQSVRSIASGTLTRHSGDEKKPLVIVFDEEENVRKLRLQITDYSNPTLTINSIYASAPARQLVYELKDPASPPLRLYFGNASVTAPHYDFENELEKKLSSEPGHSTYSSAAANPQYKPEARPLTERVPWLIYIVLAISSIALAYILFTLARKTVQAGSQQRTKGTT
jgi:hypothetical protein